MIHLLIGLTTLWSTPARARDVIVHVGLVDGAVFTRAAHEERLARLRDEHPHARVEDVLVRVDRDRLARRRPYRRLVRAEVRRRLRAIAFAPGDAVSMLVIAVHGTGGTAGSNLIPFTKILADGPVAKLRRVLRPLVGRLRTDARVVLVSCRTLAGRADAVLARSEAFLRWLNAPDGTLVGFRGPLVPSPGPRRTWASSPGDRGRAAYAGVAVTAMVLPALSVGESLATGAAVAASTLAAGALSRTCDLWLETRDVRADADAHVAWAIRLRAGRVIDTRRVEFPEGSSLGCARDLLADASTSLTLPISRSQGRTPEQGK